MNRKEQQLLRQRQTTRQLMGVTRLTEHGVVCGRDELLFYLLRPDNLSILSPEGIRGRVQALTGLLQGMASLELLALDSRESFLKNKQYYQRRLEEEPSSALRELLRQDMGHLDEIQSTTASAREFALVYRREEKSTEDAGHLKQIEKRIRDCGFHVRMAEEQDMMRLLAVYYQQDVTTEQFDRFDGERSANG